MMTGCSEHSNLFQLAQAFSRWVVNGRLNALIDAEMLAEQGQTEQVTKYISQQRSLLTAGAIWIETCY